MTPEEVQQVISEGLPECDVKVTGDGSHFDVTVIGEQFDGMSMVNQQRAVFATLGDRITSGEIHAINIKAYTPSQWETSQKMSVTSI
jgi:acid stress-induced BolA-like protein IbaG/YrbA